ncbi:CU044_5270 family protein [Streptomyces sp. NPDC088910]|uniref:CU044_5270 family protein n=1 Tax=Streptomyces sp. NPDC088910 TaxID=3365911 RepID=UPI00381D06CA
MKADNAPATVPAEAEELLAASAAWDHLSPSRHRHLKDVLMRRIDQDLARGTRTTATTTATTTTPMVATAAAPQRRRRQPRPMMVLPVAAALTAVLVVTASGGGHAPGHFPAAPPAHYNSASATLSRIAAVAMTANVTPVKDDQFVYVETLTRGNKGAFGGQVRLGALHKQEYWTVQRPGPMTEEGWIRESGKDAVMPGLGPMVATSPVYAGLDHPTYKWLATLPTDPEALRALLYAETEPWGTSSLDETVFSNIGGMLSTAIMPPATASALYQVVEKIPGVRVVPDAVDAAGRHGFGITRHDPGAATRDTWIFDKATLTYLGSRSYMIGHQGDGTAVETLYGVNAVMRRGVVDRPGEVPASVEG